MLHDDSGDDKDVVVCIYTVLMSFLQVVRQFEHSDLGCGGGGGRNNADVFSRAGLTFLTNANVEAFNTGKYSILFLESGWRFI